MSRFETPNKRTFAEVVKQDFGRKVIKTNEKLIDSSNIIDALGKALTIHNKNIEAITYLERYYRGDAPIYYREKQIRPEVNNKIHINLAYPLVELKTSEMAGEPIQYVLRGTDENKSEEISQLNAILENESKQENDIELCRWRSICGTSYRYIGNDDSQGGILDTTDFYLDVIDPRNAFVVYYNNNRPAFGCIISENEENKVEYLVFTDRFWIVTDGKDILDSGINGNRAIPLVEYPNNARRLSDVEITIGIQDAIDTLASDRENGVEQFVASFIKFVNCEIDETQFRAMRNEGALVVKSNNGSENKADVDLLTQELNQTEGQVVMDDLFNKFLIIQGIANREGNGSGDTGQAVYLRNGSYDAEKRAEIAEPSFKKAERQFVKILLQRLRVNAGFSLEPSDIEIKISRSKMDNMQVKAQTLQMLLASGINNARAIKTVNLFSDPEQVAVESKKRMDILYPETVEQQPTEEVIEVVE